MKVVGFIEDKEVTRPLRLSLRWRAGKEDFETLRDLVGQKGTVAQGQCSTIYH